MFPFAFLNNTATMMNMTAEANAVISMRLAGMIGIWSVTDKENDRMVEEKIEAMGDAQFEMWKSAITGGSADDVIAAGLKPVRNATRANAKRLSKRGFAK